MTTSSTQNAGGSREVLIGRRVDESRGSAMSHFVSGFETKDKVYHSSYSREHFGATRLCPDKRLRTVHSASIGRAGWPPFASVHSASIGRAGWPPFAFECGATSLP